jgi:hypothetical protein
MASFSLERKVWPSGFPLFFNDRFLYLFSCSLMSRWLLYLKNHFHLSWAVGGVLVASIFINLIGAFGPELGFDALWYHLTLPKLWLSMGKITFIPGGLLYYSAMPRLGEFIFLIPLKFFGEIGPHLINWLFGVGTGIVIFKLARKFVSRDLSFLAVAIFYVTPLVGWQSGSGYIDLMRTFFEVLAFYFLLGKKPLLAGLAIGLAISTKTLALGSLPILVALSVLLYCDWKATFKLVLAAGVLSAPWFIYSFIKTGYPFYPIGAGILDSTHRLLPGLANPLSLVGDYYKLFLSPEDFLTPIFVVVVPLLVLIGKKLKWPEHTLIIYWFVTYLAWWVTPRTGGGRFILPYLPVWSVLVAMTVSHLSDKFVKTIFLTFITFYLAINFLFRAGSVARLVPYLIGRETKTAYLCQHLDFKTSVFVDCDGWFSKNIKKTDLVLVSGIHNLFYISFPFVDASWYKDENYTHILVPIGLDPQTVNFKGRSLKLVYENKQVGVSLFAVRDIQYAWR